MPIELEIPRIRSRCYRVGLRVFDVHLAFELGNMTLPRGAWQEPCLGPGGSGTDPRGEAGALHRSHQPVMVEEVLEGLAVRGVGLYVDGTLGGGGHARAILERSAPEGRVLGIEWDPEGLARAGSRLVSFGERLLLHEGSYADIRQILAVRKLHPARGVLLDFGASYEQLTSAQRGFSIRNPGPLDMRFSPRSSLTAAQIVNHRSEQELTELFRAKGEERWAGRIARAVVRARPLTTTGELADLVTRVVPGRRGRIHPATRVFQALRMEVNRELENIQRGIEGAVQCLEEGGRLCVITYHSLEDRLVKRSFREMAAGGSDRPFRVRTPKPIRPAARELAANPSARSAKLRILERVGGGL